MLIYTGAIDANIVDTGNITVIAGSGQIIQGLDEAIIGMKENETKTLIISPEKGYATLYQKNNIQQLPQTLFEKANIGIEKDKYMNF